MLLFGSNLNIVECKFGLVKGFAENDLVVI